MPRTNASAVVAPTILSMREQFIMSSSTAGFCMFWTIPPRRSARPFFDSRWTGKLSLTAEMFDRDTGPRVTHVAATPEREQRTANGIQAISRAAMLMRLIARGGDEGIRLTDLTRMTGFPHPTIRRILKSL